MDNNLELKSHLISGGCNSSTHCMIWSNNGIPNNNNNNNDIEYNTIEGAEYGVLAYACDKSIAIADPINNQKIYCTLHGHTGQITSIQWIEKEIENGNNKLGGTRWYIAQNEIVSSSTDGTIRIWKCNNNITDWECTSILKLPNIKKKDKDKKKKKKKDKKKKMKIKKEDDIIIPINTISTCLLSTGDVLLTVAAINGQVIIYYRKYNTNNWIIIQEINLLQTHIMECISMTQLLPFEPTLLPSNNINNTEDLIILAMGGVDSCIHIYSADPNNLENILNIKNNEDDDNDDNDIDYINFFQYNGLLKGHQDWVRSLSFQKNINFDNNNIPYILLATASQDHKIRLWKFELIENSDYLILNNNDDINSDDDDDDDDDNLEYRIILLKDNIPKYGISFDALLFGHEDWITGITWSSLSYNNNNDNNNDNNDDNNINNQENMNFLLSSSMDRSIIIWSKDDSGVWIPEHKIGHVGWIHGGTVGGHPLGFMGLTFSPDNEYILSYGYGGSFHLWKKKIIIENIDENYKRIEWLSQTIFSGHFAPVMDITWGKGYKENNDIFSFIISVSRDQTSRLYAPIKNNNKNNNNDLWYEISRPQIHGYDMTSCILTPIPNANELGDFRLITSSEEKVIRIFHLPYIVFSGLNQLCNLKLLNLNNKGNAEELTPIQLQTAYMPELSLTNKAIHITKENEEKINQNNINEKYSINDERHTDIDEYHKEKANFDINWDNPPNDSDIVDHTLWPEMRKLFGHGNDVYTLTISHDNNILASSAKARDVKIAAIRLWDTKTWKTIYILEGHQSTVIQMKFSNNDNYLISVSKQRRIGIWKKYINNNDIIYQIYLLKSNTHKRIIWSCDWSINDEFIITGSRDTFLKFWKLIDEDIEFNNDNNKNNLIELGSFPINNYNNEPTPITSVSFAPLFYKNNKKHFLAIGLETGDIQFWSGPNINILDNLFNSPNDINWELIYKIPFHLQHGGKISRISWNINNNNNNDNNDNKKELYLATSSSDHTIRIFSIKDEFYL